jgi:hypothetical protein
MNDYVQSWVSSSAGFGDEGLSVALPANELFTAVSNVIATVVTILVKSPHQSDKDFGAGIRGEYQRFYLWNVGLDTIYGNLDRILDNSRLLKPVVLHLMSQWALAVARGIPSL